MSEEHRPTLHIGAIIGLGNPGPRYSGTRHNIGFAVADRAAAILCAPSERWLSSAGSEVMQCSLAGERLLIIKPQQFMNRSGPPAAQLLNFYKIPPERTAVVHDDVDLPTGRLRIRQGGGSGGHNGIRSLITVLGSAEFIRVRIGVGRPDPEGPPIETSDWVLGRFFDFEREEVEGAIHRAAEGVKVLAVQGLIAAQNIFNQ